ncbi:MAG: hypothetical protein H3C29_03175 [Simplicispira suum]|uniref:hypothetical protein n=1 Tax=Simplicispira suum TaxID=2109915 RepID=UPI001C6B0DD1|nr:hypothetical protein [Simplicispira suum]MBW7832194.1 hypothetical protein [Simplicispira suum]
MNNYSPILVMTLCRSEHFKKCISSLSNCRDAKKSDLYIALDHPFSESHWTGYNIILGYIKNIEGFRSVNLIKRDVNFGALKNFKDAVDQIFQKYDRCIISEDDNYFSKNFLEYINNGMDKYFDRKDIFSINGYSYRIKIPENYNNNLYLWKGFSAWGFGIWKDRWDMIEGDLDSNRCFENVSDYLSDYKNIFDLNKVASHYFPSLLRMLQVKEVIGDAYFSMYMIKNNMYCIFPVISKVRNFGHDGSGVHSNAQAKDLYESQEIDYNDTFKFNDEIDEANFEINSILKSHFKRGFKNKFKTMLFYFKYLINRYVLKI